MNPPATPGASPPAVDRGPAGPALLLEVGASATQATLIDEVAGRHRVVATGRAPATLALPAASVAPGLRAAVGEIERTTQRKLLDSTGLLRPPRPEGGVEAAVLAVGQPPRATLLALSAGPSLAAIQAALAQAGATLLESLTSRDLARAGERPLVKMLDAVARRPDLLVVAWSEERERRGSAAAELAARCLTTAIERTPGPRPAVLFVGPPGPAERVGGLLAQRTDFRSLSPVAPDVPGLAAELQAVWWQRLLARTPGYAATQPWLSAPGVPAAQALAVVLRFLAGRRGTPVWGVDVGSAGTLLVQATAESATVQAAEVGVGAAIRWALSDEVVARLRGGRSPDAVRDELGNRALRPWRLPETPDEVASTRALAREALREARRLTGAPACRSRGSTGLVVVRGSGLATGSRTADDAWAVADGLEATGTFELALDRHGALVGLGALAALAPRAAAEAILADGLLPLATVVAGEGRGRTGDPAARVELRRADGRAAQADLQAGRLVTLALDPAETAELTLTPRAGFDFGPGPGRPRSLKVRGGAAGVVVGARAPGG